MRLVQLTIPVGKRQAVMGALEDEGIDYLVTDETSGRRYAGIVYFPLPTNAVEPVLDKLYEVGIGDEAHAVIIDAETDLSREFEALTERYAAEPDGHDRIAREEIRTKAKEMAPGFRAYVGLTVISAVVATAGLLLDSPAVIVGAMVIAPLLGPAIGASVGTVVNDTDLFRRGGKLQIVGLAAAVASATAFAWLAKTTFLVPPGLSVTGIEQVDNMLTPGLLSLVIAVGAGVAGVLSLSTGVSTALVGVMIAAALVPPAAAFGIGIAWWLPTVAIASGVLVLVNMLSINLAGLATLWYLGYRPRSRFEVKQSHRVMLRRGVALAAGVVLLSLFLGSVTYTSFQDATLEAGVQGDVEAVLDSPAYADLVLLEVEVEYNEQRPFHRSEQVTVTVGRPFGTPYPELAERLAARINSRIDYDVAVQVRFVEVDQAG